MKITQVLLLLTLLLTLAVARVVKISQLDELSSE